MCGDIQRPAFSKSTGTAVAHREATRSPGTARGRSVALPAWLRGPGALYNIGNLLALFSGVAVQVVQVWGEASVAGAIRDHLMGSPGALWLTVSMVIFIVAGMHYHRGWHGPFAPDPRRVQLGDLMSGLAAIALMIALIWLGDAVLAVLAGALLAGGKLGTAVLPTVAVPERARLDSGFRMAVIVSRVPSIAALAVALVDSDGSAQQVALPAIMILCFLLWLWADLLLLRAGPVRLIEADR